MEETSIFVKPQRLFSSSLYFHNKPPLTNSSSNNSNREAVLKMNESAWPLYVWNQRVAFAHLVQALIVFILIFVHFDKLPHNLPYISESLELRFTQYVFVVVKDDGLLQQSLADNHCANDILLASSSHNNQPNDNNNNNNSLLIGGGGGGVKAMPDIMPHRYYDFGNVSAVPYQLGGVHVSPPWMMFTFFLLSFVFQKWNGYYLDNNPDRPRIWTYLEYSISSSLMIVVFGLNTGIYEYYTLTSFFALFFGMNLLGFCAEIMCYILEHQYNSNNMGAGSEEQQSIYVWVWPHMGAWILFFFAWIPCVKTFWRVHDCSDRHAPWFVMLMVILQSICFFLFGFVQLWCLWARSSLAGVNGGGAVKLERQRILYIFDAWSIGLSLFAKTLLAWLLLAPMLAVDV